MGKIKTARLGNKLFVMNGVDPLAYVDLTKVNKGNKSKAVVRYKPLKVPFAIKYTARVLGKKASELNK